MLIRNIRLPQTLEEAIERKLQQEQESLEYEFRLEKESKEAERKRIEAEGIRDFQEIVSEGISDELSFAGKASKPPRNWRKAPTARWSWSAAETMACPSSSATTDRFPANSSGQKAGHEKAPLFGGAFSWATGWNQASVQVPFSFALLMAPRTPRRLMLRMPEALTRRVTQRSSSGMKKRFLNRLG